MTSYYELLGVPRTADEREIRRAYLRLARTAHPDVDPSPEAAARFRALTDAYEALSDAARRREHDRALAGLGSPGQLNPAFQQAFVTALRQVFGGGGLKAVMSAPDKTQTFHLPNMRVTVKIG